MFSGSGNFRSSHSETWLCSRNGGGTTGSPLSLGFWCQQLPQAYSPEAGWVLKEVPQACYQPLPASPSHSSLVLPRQLPPFVYLASPQSGTSCLSPGVTGPFFFVPLTSNPMNLPGFQEEEINVAYLAGEQLAFLLFLAVPRLELRALCLLGWHSIT
jgi:hypothetical protein